MAARVDVVVVNYHSASDITQGLATLGPWPHGRIWVVDNNGDDSERDALAALAAQRAEVTVLNPGKNLGFGQGCNLAWARSDAAHVLLLNPDARLSVADAEALHAALLTDGTLGAVSPVTYWNPEGTFVLPCPSAQSPWAHMGLVAATWLPGLTRRVATQQVDRTRGMMRSRPGVKRVRFLAGAVLMLSRGAVAAAGGLFDPQFFMFFEDADLSFRLRRAGFDLGLVPEAHAVHTYRHQPFKAALMTQSQRWFFQKNHPVYWGLTGGLTGLERGSRALVPAHWWPTVGKQESAGAFSAATGGGGVWAFSPSMRMFPAIVRPEGFGVRPWSDTEWALLEPGPYVALVGAAAPSRPRRWVQFEKWE